MEILGEGEEGEAAAMVSRLFWRLKATWFLWADWASQNELLSAQVEERTKETGEWLA